MLLLVGCTRPNPAFDPDASSSEGVASNDDDVSTDVADAPDESEAESPTESEGESGEADLPAPVCEYQPAAGLNLKFADPVQLGQCPVGMDVWVSVVETGGTWIVQNCADGCNSCVGALYPLSAYPLSLDGHVPSEPLSCLRIQAAVPLGAGPEACHWGALSIYDGLDNTPYVIATAQSSEPTTAGLLTLNDLIPDPVKVANCNCDEVGQGHSCCYEAPSPPEFWGYPWDGGVVLPGQHAELEIQNPQGLGHLFKVIQAQRLYECESQGQLALSWAVVATLP